MVCNAKIVSLLLQLLVKIKKVTLAGARSFGK